MLSNGYFMGGEGEDDCNWGPREEGGLGREEWMMLSMCIECEFE